MRLRLLRGDISRAKAGAIITSANDALIGNENPLYWRFTSRKNVDGAVREAAGPGLRAACLALPEVEAAPYADEEPRDISRWAETAKRGASATLRCAPGAAVATRAFGLEADWCVHAVAPDSEFGYEGHYQGMPGIRGEEVRARSRPPLARLRGSYESALDICREVGASSVAVPALGAGVKGWAPAVTAAFGLDAAARAAGGGLDAVAFVLGDDAAWRDWARVAAALLGPPAGGGAGLADAAASGADLEWTLAPAAAGGGDALRLRDLPEFGRPRASWATEAAGTRSGGNAWRWNPSDVRAV